MHPKKPLIYDIRIPKCLCEIADVLNYSSSVLLSLVPKSTLLKSKNDNSPSDRDLKIFKQSKFLHLSIERKKNFCMIIPNFWVGKSMMFCSGNTKCYGNSWKIVHKTSSMCWLKLTATNITSNKSEVEEELEEDSSLVNSENVCNL